MKVKFNKILNILLLIIFVITISSCNLDFNQNTEENTENQTTNPDNKTEEPDLTIGQQIINEYLALKNNASIALKACEHNDNEWKKIIKKQIDKQLDSGTLNDMLVRKNYGVLKQCIDTNTIKNIEYMIIWAEHFSEPTAVILKSLPSLA